MISTARLPQGRGLLLALLVGVLLGGMIGMHHLAVGGGSVPSAGAPVAGPVPMSVEHDPGDGGHDDGEHHDGAALLHLCLAVLAAVAVLVVVLVLWRRTPADRVPAAGGGRRVTTRPRGPPRGAPARLALLCVLRT